MSDDDQHYIIDDEFEDYDRAMRDTAPEDILQEDEDEYVVVRPSYYPYKKFREYSMDNRLSVLIDNANIYPFGILHPDTETSLFFKYHSQTHYIYSQLMLTEGDKTIMSNLRMGSNYRGVAFDLIRKHVTLSIENSLFNYFKYLYDSKLIPDDEMNVEVRHKYPETRYMPNNMAGIILDSVIHGKQFTQDNHMKPVIVRKGMYNTPMRPVYRDGKIVFEYNDSSGNMDPVVLDVEERVIRSAGILSLDDTEIPISDGRYNFRSISQYVWFNVYKMFIDEMNAHRMSDQAFRHGDYEGVFENEVLFNYTSIKTQEAFHDILKFIDTDSPVELRNMYLGLIKSVPFPYSIVDNFQIFGSPISSALTHLHSQMKRNLIEEQSIAMIPFIEQKDLERTGKLTEWVYNVQVPTMVSMIEIVYKYIQFHSSQTSQVIEHLYAPLHWIRQERQLTSMSQSFPKEFHTYIKKRLSKNEALWDVLTENDQNESLYDIWATIVQLYEVMPTKSSSNDVMKLNKSMNTALIMRLLLGDVEKMYIQGFKNFNTLKRRLRNQLMPYREYRKLIRELCGMDKAIKSIQRAKLSISESPRVTSVKSYDMWGDYMPSVDIIEPLLLSIDGMVDASVYEEYINKSMFIDVDAKQILKDVVELYNLFQYGKLRGGVDIIVPVFSRFNLVGSHII